MSSATLADRLIAVRLRVAQACRVVGRDPDEVRILPVSKTQPTGVIREAMEVGWTTFGENRVQDMVVKAAEFPGASWEMIGHLQRNKAQLACSVMTKLHSLDSLELAEKLESILALNQHQRLLDVLVEVNTSEESTKHGIPGDQVLDFAAQLRRSPHLRPCGLMTVAHPDPRRAEAGFRLLASLRHQLMERDHGGWEELSMGMSSDLELAIAHGSTCVRLGTAIFGSRHP